MALHQPRWPVAPLLAAAAAGRPLHVPDNCPGCTGHTPGRCITLVEAAARLATTDRTIHRWIAEGGVPDRSADAAAVALGLVPEIIWPTYATGAAA